MKKRIIALTIYTLTWILFFLAARLFFIIFQFREAALYNVDVLFSTFMHGIKLDISTTGYFLLIPVVVIIPSLLVKGSWYKIFLSVYTVVLVIVSVVLIVSDANLYTYWGFRMDYTPLLYLKTPADAAASATSGQFFANGILIISFSAISLIIFKNIINRFFTGFERITHPVPGIIFYIIILGSLIIPIRGGVGIAPINAGTVYFHESMFPNHTAINVVWNVGNSAIYQESDKNPYEYSDLGKATEIVNWLTSGNDTTVSVLNTKRPNILIIILESFGSYLVGPLGGDAAITPNLNRYIEEGIVFKNFYATGSRTDKAIPALLSGYPGQPANSIIKDPKKSQSLPGLIKLLKESGYSSEFWYGGDINFANFNSFVISSGFGKIITKDNFDPENYNSKWGVHDHIMLESLSDSMTRIEEPFVNVVLTLSSHEPFEVPMEPVITGSDEISKFENSVYYTDKSIGWFIEESRKKEWWKNTLVILVADHCRRNSSEIPVYSEEIFKIPMVWLGGALSVSGIEIEKKGSQVDIPVTIANQLGLEGDFRFGKDLLSEKTKSFAFYTFNEGFAFIDDSSATIYDHKLKKPVLTRGPDPQSSEEYGKAYLQVLYSDYLAR